MVCYWNQKCINQCSDSISATQNKISEFTIRNTEFDGLSKHTKAENILFFSSPASLSGKTTYARRCYPQQLQCSSFLTRFPWTELVLNKNREDTVLVKCSEAAALQLCTQHIVSKDKEMLWNQTLFLFFWLWILVFHMHWVDLLLLVLTINAISSQRNLPSWKCCQNGTYKNSLYDNQFGKKSPTCPLYLLIKSFCTL